MKLRLQITASPNRTFTVEHTTPRIRIGRDPQSEVAMGGDSTKSVSWDHCRIEITNRCAVLHDLGSTNGTYLNGQRLFKPARLRAADQIQLGNNGPRLQVMEIDLIGAPVDTAEGTETLTPVKSGRSPWIEQLLVGAAVVVAFGLIAGVTAFIFAKPDRPTEPGPAPVVLNGDPTDPNDKPPDKKSPDEKPPDKKPPDEKPPDKKPPDEKPPDKKPTTERLAIGKYERSPKSPSILLQKKNDAAQWQQVQAQERVTTGDLLISLPGYRSEVNLDSGVQLLLWGNVVEQLNLPFLESAVVLNNPTEGVDLNFTLDRGRVLIANRKPEGSAKVQVRFASEVWDITLVDSQCEVGIDLIGREIGDDAEKGPLAFLSLMVVKGHARLTIGFQKYSLQAPPGPAEFTWSNRGTGPQGPLPKEELPPYWNKTLPAAWQWERFPPAERDNLRQAYENMRKALEELNGRLTEKGKLLLVLEEGLTSPQTMSRMQAVQSLGAIDDLAHLLDALGDEKHFDVREAAVNTLRHWLGRRAGQEKILRQALEDKRVPPSQADIILQLLHTFSRDALADKQTYGVLIEYLRHENPAVRQLAYWHLSRIVPDARKILYDPGVSVQQSKAGYEQWRKLLAEGKLPPKLASPPPKP